LRRLETDLLTGAFWLLFGADKIGRGRRSLSGINQPAVAAGTLSGKRPLVSLMCAPITARVSLPWGTAPGAWPLSVRMQDSRPSAPDHDFQKDVIAKQPLPVVSCAGSQWNRVSPGSSGREVGRRQNLEPTSRPSYFCTKGKSHFARDGGLVALPLRRVVSGQVGRLLPTQRERIEREDSTISCAEVAGNVRLATRFFGRFL
jgi:hypothetical protein